MTDQDNDVVWAMETYGGSFVKALAAAARCADAINLEKLKLAFPEYWQRYAEMAENAKP